jgi:hypothetical protein
LLFESIRFITWPIFEICWSMLINNYSNTYQIILVRNSFVFSLQEALMQKAWRLLKTCGAASKPLKLVKKIVNNQKHRIPFTRFFFLLSICLCICCPFSCIIHSAAICIVYTYSYYTVINRLYCMHSLYILIHSAYVYVVLSAVLFIQLNNIQLFSGQFYHARLYNIFQGATPILIVD